MRPREALSRLDRAQRSMPFKIIASIIVVALAIAGFSSYVVAVKAPVNQPSAASTQTTPPTEAGADGQAGESQLSAADKSAIESAQRVYQDLMTKRADPLNVGLGVAVITGLVLIVIWLGLTLTYIGLFALAGLLVLPMWIIARTAMAEGYRVGDEASLAQTLRAAIRLILGGAALTAAFTALLQGLRIVLSGSHPVLAIARNMVAEAVRMKISLVFIVILIFAMAALPGSLSQDTPLRYRVQAFLQYGTGGSYWIIAILVLFFAAASVAFEQRDRQIWQTMTKPVAPWQYILGKWIGVSGLAAILLAVSCSGVFLFTEYLRQQPAAGETAQAIAAGQQGLTTDRMMLETQVLAARRTTEAVLPMSKDDPEFKAGLENYILENRKRDPSFATDAAMYNKIIEDSWKQIVTHYFSIAPGGYGTYTFKGLEEAKRRNMPLTLRYKLEGGTQTPDQLYKVTFVFGGVIQPSQEVTLGPTQTLTLYPTVVADDGTVELSIYNGALVPAPDGSPAIVPNPGTISFPKDGLELSYPVGSYRANFMRVAIVLWIKLAFLAMLAITAATFLSFPVACLVAFSVFIIAEGAGFLSQSLEYYDAVSSNGRDMIYWRIPIRGIGLAVAWMFNTYADLRPTTKLVDGRLMAWTNVAWGVSILAAWCAALYGVATLIFRRRELATYSGQ